jgi:hypothetical protein
LKKTAKSKKPAPDVSELSDKPVKNIHQVRKRIEDILSERAREKSLEL